MVIEDKVSDQLKKIEELQAFRAAEGAPPEIVLGKRDSSKKPKRKNTCNLWSIDKLYNNNVIDTDQHYAGVHIRFWRECAIASHLKAVSLETIRVGTTGDMDGLAVTRLDAVSLMSKIIIAMKEREMKERMLLWAPCVWVAIDDLTISHAAAKLGKRLSDGRAQVQFALTCMYEELEKNGLLFWQR